MGPLPYASYRPTAGPGTKDRVTKYSMPGGPQRHGIQVLSLLVVGMTPARRVLSERPAKVGQNPQRNQIHADQ